MELMNWQWEIEMLLRLVLAVLLSGIIGMEREALNKIGGLPHAHFGRYRRVPHDDNFLVDALYPYAGDFGATGSNSDPARIAAQVVSGIGFLGAGAIMSSSGKVRGLTTAASLWAVARDWAVRRRRAICNRDRSVGFNLCDIKLVCAGGKPHPKESYYSHGNLYGRRALRGR